MRTQPKRNEATVAGLVSMVVLAVGLVVTAADVPMAWVVWPLGYGVVLPLAIGYAKRRQREPREFRARGEPDRLAEAKRRYVDGDIDEAEFERAVEAAMQREGSA